MPAGQSRRPARRGRVGWTGLGPAAEFGLGNSPEIRRRAILREDQRSAAHRGITTPPDAGTRPASQPPVAGSESPGPQATGAHREAPGAMMARARGLAAARASSGARLGPRRVRRRSELGGNLGPAARSPAGSEIFDEPTAAGAHQGYVLKGRSRPLRGEETCIRRARRRRRRSRQWSGWTAFGEAMVRLFSRLGSGR